MPVRIVAPLALAVVLAACDLLRPPSDLAPPTSLPEGSPAGSPVAPHVELGTHTPEPALPLPSQQPVAPDSDDGPLTPEPTVAPASPDAVAPDADPGVATPDPTVALPGG